MAAFETYMVEMMKNPPDPNEPLPLSNRPATLYGATLPFHLLSWAAVLFRLHVRFRTVREPGWDDYLIMLCIIFNLGTLVGLYGAVENGLGHHMIYIESDDLLRLMKFLYAQLGAYNTCAGLVKVSLLCQYLRLFKKGIVRYVCIFMLVASCIWTVYWCIQGWFPCFPVSGFWDRLQQPPPKCWGTGFSTVEGALMAMYAFAASNMTLDVIIFAIPITIYVRPGLKRRDILALTALFLLGAVVVLMSIIRLWSAVDRKIGDPWSMDYTYWYPTTLIIASIEIDFAIICASIPIFWPVIVAALPQIFVTQEVHVTHHDRIDDFEMARPNSLKSYNSQEGLTRQTGLKTNYSDPYTLDHVCGKVANAEVESVPKKKRWLT